MHSTQVLVRPVWKHSWHRHSMLNRKVPRLCQSQLDQHNRFVFYEPGHLFNVVYHWLISIKKRLHALVIRAINSIRTGIFNLITVSYQDVQRFLGIQNIRFAVLNYQACIFHLHRYHIYLSEWLRNRLWLALLLILWPIGLSSSIEILQNLFLLSYHWPKDQIHDDVRLSSKQNHLCRRGTEFYRDNFHFLCRNFDFSMSNKV